LKSIASYAAVMDALPIVAYMADPDGHVTYVSRGWERFTGKSAAEVVSRGYEVVIHPDDVARVAARWAAARHAGDSYRDEFRMRFGDGTYRWVVSQADAVRQEAGGIVAWCGTVIDVHDRRLAEDAMSAALRTSGERAEVAKRLLEASDDCVTVLDTDGRIVSMSVNGRQAFGITDFATVKGADWLCFWSGDERIAAQAAVEAARAGGRRRFTGFFAIEGHERCWDVAVTPILGGSGRPEQLLAVSRDITEALAAQRELAKSEERYRLLTESLPGTAWTATPDGLLDHISEGSSPSVRRPVAARLGDGWLEGVHPDDRERVRALWQHSVDSGDPYETQFRVRMADGSYRWKLVRAMPQRDEDGSICRWVGVNVDIDEQRRAHEEREMFVALAENSSDIVGITDPDGNVVYGNPAARELLSLDDPRSIHFTECFSPEDREFVNSVVVPAMERDGRWVGEFRMRNFRTGAPVPILYNAFVLKDARGKKMGLATISRDLRERRRIDIGMRALADAAAVMYGSLDYEETLGNIADAVMRTFATSCTIDVLDEDGAFRRVAIAHPRADMRAVFEQYNDQGRFQPGHPIFEAIRHGASTCASELGAEWAARATPSNVEAVAKLRIRSFLCVPVRAPDGSVLGALTCSLDRDDPRPSFVPDDLPFAEELGRRAGIDRGSARTRVRPRARDRDAVPGGVAAGPLAGRRARDPDRGLSPGP
jgi:PAS domain S-box-containing protein